jgi:hypothetical protein
MENGEFLEDWLERTMRDSNLPRETQLAAAMTARILPNVLIFAIPATEQRGPTLRFGD